MIVETKGANTTKPMEQKIHHLRRVGLSGGGVFRVPTVGWLVVRSMESEVVGIIQFEMRQRSVKHWKTRSKYKGVHTTRKLHAFE